MGLKHIQQARGIPHYAKKIILFIWWSITHMFRNKFLILVKAYDVI